MIESFSSSVSALVMISNWFFPVYIAWWVSEILVDSLVTL
ncbi:hypothetical protein CWATWH0003_0493 [Crocosphaera watsonii WH 0003]|uniref:Uncharacterized protein n=1 Tax=Crocosphaera watsonii WH 0003 TaxID=423471 RepID=G5IYZ6_CROWT|nr:hypothetical protein CWATWH0003_0493 [Crocosphaera watsonii WH 0003]